MTTEPRDRFRKSAQWGLWAAAVLVFFGTRLPILGTVEFLSRSSDVVRYHDNATRNKAGEVPYQDLQIEYPPVAWWLMWLPGQFDLQAQFDANFPLLRHYPAFQDQMHGIAPGRDIFPLTGQKQSMDRLTRIRAADLIVYYHRFRTQMFLLEALTFLVFGLWVHRIAKARAATTVLAAVAVNGLLAPVLYDRLDVALALGLMGFAAAGVRKFWGAHVAVGLSIALKAVPVVVVPFLVLADRRRPDSRKYLGWGLGLVTGLMPFLWHASAGSGVWSWIAYHAQRGLEAESTGAGLVMVGGRLLGQRPQVEESFGSLNLTCTVCRPVAGLGTLLLAGAVIVIAGWAWRRRHQLSYSDALDIGLWVVLLSVVLSKVFSPQYLVWANLIALGLGARFLGTRSLVGLWVTVGVIAGLTTWLFPYHFISHVPYTLPVDQARLVDPLGLLPAMSWPALSVLMLRNGLFAGMVAWLGWAGWRRMHAQSLRSGC